MNKSILSRCTRMASPWIFLGMALLSPAFAAAPPMPPQLCMEESGECTPLVVAGDGVKWNPGIYVRHKGARVPFLASDYFSTIDELAEMPNVRGIKVHVYWASLEGAAPGSYTFNEVWTLYNYLKARQLRLGLHLQTRDFDADCSRVAPSYLTKTGTSQNEAGSSCMALLWNPEVMDRYIALMRALASDFDGESHFEALMFTETATGSPYPSSAEFSASAYLSQIKRLIDAASEAWPRTNKVIYFNFLSGSNQSQQIELYQYMYNNGIAVGGPDTFPTIPGEAHGDIHSGTQGMRVRKGDVGDVDFRFDGSGNYRHAAIMDVQPSQMGGRQGNWTPAELMSYAWNHNAVSHIFITRKNYQADPATSEPDCANWSPPSGSFDGCRIGFQAFIDKGLALPPVRNTKCPANYARGCQ